MQIFIHVCLKHLQFECLQQIIEIQNFNFIEKKTVTTFNLHLNVFINNKALLKKGFFLKLILHIKPKLIPKAFCGLNLTAHSVGSQPISYYKLRQRL